MRWLVARDSKEDRRGSGYTLRRSIIRIADVDGEEFEEAGPGPFPAPPCFPITTKSPMPDPSTGPLDLLPHNTFYATSIGAGEGVIFKWPDQFIGRYDRNGS